MNNNFEEQLSLYKAGKLGEEEARRVEEEIARISAILDHIKDEEEEMWEELKNEVPANNTTNFEAPVKWKRKINAKIIWTSAITALAIWIAFVTIVFASSRIVTGLFALDHEESYVERSAFTQMVQMFQPDYESSSSWSTSGLFAKQGMGVLLKKYAGHTVLDTKEITVNYQLGQPKDSNAADVQLFYREKEDFSSLAGYPSDPDLGFEPLEKAPSGTTANVLILFKEALSPQELKDSFVAALYPDDTSESQVTPLTLVSDRIVLSNPSYYRHTPVYPYGENQEDINENRGKLSAQFESYDNSSHANSMIGNLRILQGRDELLETLFHAGLLDALKVDEAIVEIERNGIRYFGSYFTADTKKLLELKGDPRIHSIQVESIVLW
ncbi:anti sigma factor C-terminal domain-containing protein [Alkalibacter rhizosphaerae]|uniref:Anti sigma factor C-terminal domain-containing protein n=1 Tax=Alkalibacter rhizosphaerae TaxID=2815577 RepID=A0A975AIC3_9FIRM|nr:anti sigma factor C-terminal domain-containing protein [Alkalibacter rhizosphaerae]QSX08529.1 anti sigma factor C-terminal domain-containing protein [Alkalibacter rhizosphaerae]